LPGVVAVLAAVAVLTLPVILAVLAVVRLATRLVVAVGPVPQSTQNVLCLTCEPIDPSA
jgi:hypothetical protein